MPKVLTSAQIAQKQAQGARIERPVERREVSGMEALVAEFKRVADSMDALVEKRNDEMIGAINRLTETVKSRELKGGDVKVDMSPIAEVLKQLQQPVQKTGWNFTPERDNRGLISNIRAIPVQEIKH